jgi:AcrR family transcriptional regulator
MPDSADNPEKPTKGQRTATRILDAAEDLFARRGYDGCSLRQIAESAGIQEPGLYNHFSSKQALYEAVLHRALDPMNQVLSEHLESAEGLRDYTDLPAVMTDLMLEHPQIAALFHQALMEEGESTGNKLVQDWLDRLFDQGMRKMLVADDADDADEHDRATLAINVIALFNLTTGYFLSQRAFESMATGDLKSPDNIARQKKLLHRVVRAMLVRASPPPRGDGPQA